MTTSAKIKRSVVVVLIALSLFFGGRGVAKSINHASAGDQYAAGISQCWRCS